MRIGTAGSVKVFVTILAIATAAAIAPMLYQPGPTPHKVMGFDEGGRPRPPRSAEIDEWMADIRQAGLHGDRSRINEMAASLWFPKYPDVLKTSLNALAQLGAVEALPDIDTLIRNQKTEPEDRNYAIAARARLVAESSSASIHDSTTRTAATISRLRREIGLSSSRINAAARAYGGGGGSKFYRLPPVEVFAMRQLADIAYRNHYATPNGVPGAADIDFYQDPASALKVKLALLPDSQRANWLIGDLVHLSIKMKVEPYEVQLASDEGLPASRAAALLLNKMEKQRDQYSFDGFGALSEVMMGIGDKTQLPLLERLSHDPNPRLASFWRLAYTRDLCGKRSVLVDGY